MGVGEECECREEVQSMKHVLEECRWGSEERDEFR